MSKKDKLQMIVDKVLTEVEGQNTIVAMLKPILTNFIAKMKEEEVDKMIKIIKAIIRYLEDENKGVNEDGKEDKKVNTFTR